MLIPRVIPCLLLYEDSFVKTIKFKKINYIGDPVNTINLFNKFEVDEIILLDIGCPRHDKQPCYNLIEDLASECWVPMTYGGGIRNVQQAEKVFNLGVEKIVLDSLLYPKIDAVVPFVERFGSSSIVAAVNVRRVLFRGYRYFYKAGTQKGSISISEFTKNLELQGVGEIFLNNIDYDGLRCGLDLDLIALVSKNVSIPVIACGGAESIFDLRKAVDAGASAVAAGSLFVYQKQGSGVLVNFPERSELENIFNNE
jgi:imidazole glycerol-phosphate synthase subunit HisF